MRRAFTLIELLVIVAIIGLLVTVSVVSVQEGRQYAAIRGSVRTVFATIRQARSIALVSQKPAVITFSSERAEGMIRSKIAITSVNLMETKANVIARSITGEWRTLGDDSPIEPKQISGLETEQPSTTENSGQTVEEILFSPVSEDVLTGVRIKVVMDSEEFDQFTVSDKEVKRSRVSIFSNVDFLMNSFKKGREKEKERKEKEKSENESDTPLETEELEPEKSVAWQTNGRCDAHKIYIYPEGRSINDAWIIRVDRFGGVKVLEDGDE